MKTMKLAPSNFPNKAVVPIWRKNHAHGMEQYIIFGDVKDPNAISIFVDGDNICNANLFYNVLDGCDHKNRAEGCLFFTKHSDYEH